MKIKVKKSSYDEVLRVLNKYATGKYLFDGNGYVILHDEISAEVYAYQKDYIEIKRVCKLKNVDGRHVNTLVKLLRQDNLLSDDWKACLLQKDFISKKDYHKILDRLDELLVLTKNEKRCSVNNISQEYGIRPAVIKKNIMAGRIAEVNGEIVFSTFLEVYNHDNRLIPISSILKEILESDNLRWNERFESRLKEYITLKLGDCVLQSEFALIKDKITPNELYVESGEQVSKEIWNFIKKNAYQLEVESINFLWKQMGPITREMLIAKYGEPERVTNIALRRVLVRLMGVIWEFQADLPDWSENQLVMLTKRKDTRALVEKLNALLRLAQKKQYKINSIPCNIISKPRKRIEEEKKDMLRQKEFMMLGCLLFDDDYMGKYDYVGKALESIEVSHAFLYMMLHYVVTWRKQDILDFKLPEIENLDELIEKIRLRKFDTNDFKKIWNSVEFKWRAETIRANKNKGELVFACPEEFKTKLGIFLIIGEWHRICKKESSLFFRSRCLSEVGTYTAALGDYYTKIFGNKVFRNRITNKRLLQVYLEFTQVKFKHVGMKTLPHLVASYLCGHKFDFEHCQQSILHYINYTTEGMNIDEVTMTLYRIGTFGMYADILLTQMIPAYKDSLLSTKADCIEKLNLEPTEHEMFINQHHKILELFEKMNISPDNYKELMAKIGEAFVIGKGIANDDNVFCIYTGITGVANPECSMGSHCVNCGTNYCQYAIYTVDYVLNLIGRLEDV